MTAKTPTTYKIKVITNFDDCEPQYDLFDFTTNKVTKAKGADTLFIEAVKDAVKDWVKDDPDDAESYIADTRSIDRDDYDSAEEYVLAGFMSRFISVIPDKYLNLHGITYTNPGVIELEYDEFDDVF
jgi:hypothetical protein